MGGVDVSAQGGNNAVVNSLQERSMDSSGDGGVVDHGSLDRGFVDQGSVGSGVVEDGLVDSSSVDQGGVSLSLGLTLGDVRHNGAGGEGLQGREDLAQDGSGQSGVVDTGNCVGQGSLEGRVVDQRSLEGRVVDHRFVGGGRV